jgi:uncharacterized protein
MSRSKASLVEEARPLGIASPEKLPYGTLVTAIRMKKHHVPKAERGVTPAAQDPFERNLRVRLYQDKHNDWRWSLLSGNNQIVADSSEGYVTKWGCKRAFQKFIGLK